MQRAIPPSIGERFFSSFIKYAQSFRPFVISNVEAKEVITPEKLKQLNQLNQPIVQPNTHNFTPNPESIKNPEQLFIKPCDLNNGYHYWSLIDILRGSNSEAQHMIFYLPTHLGDALIKNPAKLASMDLNKYYIGSNHFGKTALKQTDHATLFKNNLLEYLKKNTVCKENLPKHTETIHRLFPENQKHLSKPNHS